MIAVLFAAEFIVCFIVCISFFWWSCLEAPLCTTIVMIVKHLFERNLTCFTELFKFTLYYFLSCTPNISWVGEHLICCIYTTEPYFCGRWKICAYIQLSRDGRDLQGRMYLGFTHQAFLGMTPELDLRHLWRYAWSQLALYCHCRWLWHLW